MHWKHWMAAALFLAAPAVAAAPEDVDVTGTWSLSGEVQGVSVQETCVLAQSADAKVTGSCDTSTGKYETTGTVKEKTVILQHGGKYQGTDLSITYTGKVGSDGAMTGTMDVDPYAVTGSFSAKKGTAAQ